MELTIEAAAGVPVIIDVPDADMVLQAAIEDDSVDAYAHTVWAAGIAAARALATVARNGDTVLDVGCGLGVVSLTALGLGLRVVAVDHDARALVHVVNAAYRQHFEVQTTQIETLVFDLFSAATLPEADVCVFSDLLYDTRLAAAAASHVARVRERAARVVIADPARAGRSVLVASLRDAGHDVVFEDVDVVLPDGSTAVVGLALL